jgi:hypothetical protein
MPQRKRGGSARLLIRSRATFPVRKAAWPGAARIASSSSLLGWTWWRTARSIQNCTPCLKPAVSMVTFFAARSTGP